VSQEDRRVARSSGQKRSGAAVAGTALAALLALGLPAHGQEGGGKALEVRRIERQVEQIRGLAFDHSVKVELRTKAELGRYLETVFEKEVPEKETALSQAFLQHLALIPKGSDLRQTMLRILRENVAGFYDPPRETLWIIGDAGAGSQAAQQEEMTILHELVHALEDQHFDLQARDEAVKGNDDRASALQGMIEGSATYAMFQPMLGSGGNQVFTLKGMSLLMDATGPMGGSADAPDFLMAQLIYPYASGLTFVGALAERGGYGAAVTRAYKAPPRSTEQVLHPEKYLAPEPDEPIERRMPDLGGALGEGWTQMGQNTMGELGFRLAFRQWLVLDPAGSVLKILPEESRGLGKALVRFGSKLFSSSDPESIAAGWDGDRYAVLRHATGRTALCWWTTWDTIEDAREFELAYRRAASKRGASVEVRRRGRRVSLVDGVPVAARATVFSRLAPANF